MMKKVLEIFMFKNCCFFAGVFICLFFSSCATAFDVAYIENEDEFENSDFKLTVIDTWTNYERNCKIGDYFIDFTTDIKYDKKDEHSGFSENLHTDYSWHEEKKHGGILLKNNEPVYEIYMYIVENGVQKRANYTTFGYTNDIVKGSRNLYFLIGENLAKIQVNTAENIVLEDNSVIPIVVEKVDEMRRHHFYRGEFTGSEIIKSDRDNGSGEIVKINGEEYVFLDLKANSRTVLFKKDFSQNLSDDEKNYVISIIILLCELRDKYEVSHSTERNFDYVIMEKKTSL